MKGLTQDDLEQIAIGQSEKFTPIIVANSFSSETGGKLKMTTLYATGFIEGFNFAKKLQENDERGNTGQSEETCANQ
jgi:hypothetical protein